MANDLTAGMIGFAEALGEALGRGVARGINAGLSGGNTVAPAGRRSQSAQAVFAGPVPAEKRCKVDGCPSAARAKGLCSKHYQAERRQQSEAR